MAVAICRGFEGSEDRAWLPRAAERFARAGFAAVTIAFKGQSTEANHLKDLDTVLRALREGQFGFFPSGIGLVGVGLGRRIAVRHAAEDTAIAALVTWAGPAPEAAQADERVRAPWLIVPETSPADSVLDAGVEWLTRYLPV